MDKNIKREFYIYVYLDQTKYGNYVYEKFKFNYEPFYVGLGKRECRLYEHLKETEENCYNKHKIRRIRKIQKETKKNPIIIKYSQNLTKDESVKLEILMIKTIGRRDLKIGPLTNLTKGGDGVVEYIQTKEYKEKWKRSIDIYYSDTENRKRSGYKSTKEYYVKNFGLDKGLVKYYDRIERIRISVNKTYKDPEIRKKCSNKGKKNGMFGIPSPVAKKIKVNGICYNSILEASEKENIPYTTLSQRLSSKYFKEYNILEQKK